MHKQLVALGLTLLLTACGGDSADDDPGIGPDGMVSAEGTLDYRKEAMWLCHPDSANNACQADLTALERHADGSETRVDFQHDGDQAFDCFYVYPTVKIFGGGLDLEFKPELKLDPLLSQAAWLRGQCRIFAPYYRQVALDEFNRAPLEAIAYGDVRGAFLHYLEKESQGRNFALLGHSQGSFMLGDLLRDVFDARPELKDRLISAVLPGANHTWTPGEATTSTGLPLCEAPGQTGCLVSWVTFADEAPPGGGAFFGRDAARGQQVVCSDPTVLAGREAGRVTGSYFPTSVNNPAFAGSVAQLSGIEEPFVLYRDAISSGCKREGSFTWYEVAIELDDDDQREPPSLRDSVTESIGFGAHLIDWNIPLMDILEMVRQQAAAMP